MQKGSDKELTERLAAALSSYPIRDDRHPLADQPKDRLYDALCWTLGDSKRSDLVNHFADFIGVSVQAMRGYLNDSTAVTNARLAQIADWAAKIQVLNESNYADELINDTDTPMFGFEATEQERYDMGYRLFISNLFGVTPIDLEKIKRLELIRAALTCSTEELDALTATVRLMPTQRGGYPANPITNESATMSRAAVEVLPYALESIERELPPLEEWAQSSVEWAKANKAKPLDIPF
ncbi:hypothetical protein ACTQY7_02530 [Collinsella sp. LCP19S3_G12]|uniref:hypothetical protein n=1 Tax=Collinsella sp. LCP19S3_G12 TaxID=3438767 RepID=UPI003F90E8A1